MPLELTYCSTNLILSVKSTKSLCKAVLYSDLGAQVKYFRRTPVGRKHKFCGPQEIREPRFEDHLYTALNSWSLWPVRCTFSVNVNMKWYFSMSRPWSYDPAPRNHMQVRGLLYGPAALSSGKNTFTDWVGGWVGPRSRLDVKGEGKISRTYRIQTPDSPSLILYRPRSLWSTNLSFMSYRLT